MNKLLKGTVLFSLVCLVGCQPTAPQINQNTQLQTPVEFETETSTPTDHTSYDKLFYQGTETLAYNGYAEYGYLLTLEETCEGEAGEKIYTYRGIMNDGLGDVDGTRYFKATYTITDDSVVETIDNQDPHRQQESNALLNSIIPSKVVLKGALETGTSWTETFEYDGQTYEASNQLTVQTSESGVTQYRVDTVVKNMPGYIQPDYVETRIYEAGKGLVSFTNLQPLSQFDEDYPKDYPEVEFYQFGYAQTGIQQAPDED